MFNIALINMPFARVQSPSLGLAQLKAVVDQRHRGSAKTEVLHLNHDFMHFLGTDLYDFIAFGKEAALYTGLGEWVFRRSAFPEASDNIEKYFARYRHHFASLGQDSFGSLRDLTIAIGGFLDSLIEKYDLAHRNLVGFTSMFAQNTPSIAMARRLKDRRDNIIVAMGGANCESPMGEQIVKNVGCVDFVFSGCGLKSFPEFVTCCLAGDLDECRKIPGIFSRENRESQLSVVGCSPANAMGEELDIDTDLAVDYEEFIRVFEENFPDGNLEPSLPFETSRGCWWGQRAHCTFCGLNGSTMAYRALNPALAIDRIKSLFKYSPKVTRLDAVDNIMPRSYLKEVLPSLDPPADVRIFYEVKTDLNEDDFKVLARAHVWNVQPGIESFCTSTLKLMKKGSSAAQNLQFLKNCLIHKISPDWNLLVGFPGEEESVYKKYLFDIPHIVHLPAPSGVFPVRFDRFSPYFTRAHEYHLALEPLDFYSLVYPFSQESLSKMAYYFNDQNYGAEYMRNIAKWIHRLEGCVGRWTARWKESNDEPFPKLYFESMEPDAIVYDSRSEAVQRHKLTPDLTRILRMATVQKRVEEIVVDMRSIPESRVLEYLRCLVEMGLLFEENGRVFSIVMQYDTSMTQG